MKGHAQADESPLGNALRHACQAFVAWIFGARSQAPFVERMPLVVER